MSSKPGIATVENTSEVEGPGMQAQGGAIGINPVPQATNPNDNPRNHDIDILQEEKMTEHDAMPSLLPGDAELNPQKPSDFPGDTPHPELSDPRTTTRPDFDPFERLFKPMLEQDTVQCNAWKDEVQNILIFAGLFSAVVTAFIIESYQRLKPDPSDTIVSLLAHIAERLDNPSIGGTASVLSIISDTNLSPSRSDISINVFWFISLVFSLTAALIGIITLQWLREHQRYDNTLKPQQMMAIFNERLDSLQQWYVPQIFAGLPLLLQGALVLFFAGMIEFLFALRLEVAVPVALSVCIPLVFLIATTVLPLLQVCILEDPFRLSVNNKVPSPCPYKSPQSLIFRRICVHSKTIFQFFTSIVTGTYACVVYIICFVRKLAGYPVPIFHSQQPHLRLKLHGQYQSYILYGHETQWTSIDVAWLSSRTVYALSLQLVYTDDNDDIGSWTMGRMNTSLSAETYDCTRCLRRILDQSWASADHYALYHCVEQLFSKAMDNFKLRLLERPQTNTPYFCLAFGKLLFDVYVPESDNVQPTPLITAAFIKDALLDDSQDGSQTTIETLCAAFMATQSRRKTLAMTNDGVRVLLQMMDHLRGLETAIQTGETSRFMQNMTHLIESMPEQTRLREPLQPTIQTIANNGASLLVLNRLRINPQRLFTMSNGDMWLPQILRYSVHLRENHSSSVTHLLHAFLEHCSKMPSNSQPVALLQPQATSASKSYGGIVAYMNTVVLYQTDDSLNDTLAHLILLCNLSAVPDLVQEKPFLMFAACFYLDATTTRHYRMPEAFGNILCSTPNYEPLLSVILEACGIRQGQNHVTKEGGWTGLNTAINAIQNHHSHTTQAANLTFSTPPINPHGHESNV